MAEFTGALLGLRGRLANGNTHVHVIVLSGVRTPESLSLILRIIASAQPPPDTHGE